MTISFHLVHIKLLEEGSRTWLLEDCFAALTSKSVLRNISGKSCHWPPLALHKHSDDRRQWLFPALFLLTI